MSQAKQSKNPARRIAEYNIKRLVSLAGQLQMESSEEKSLNDAIDYLFTYLFECKEQEKLIKKKEKENES
jgi:hypothetical protein